MGIGAYRHLVTLEHPAVELDPPTWACSLQPAGQVSDGLAAFLVRGRFHPGIGLETQFVFEGRTFQVQAVNDLDERHKEIQVTAVEVVGRGTTPSGVPVNVPPTIVEGPASATIDAGESVILTVIAVGAAPLAYQWTADGVDLPGEVYQFLETGPVTVTTAYAVRVSNAYGAVLSAPAIVTVTVEAPSYQDTVIADGASAYWPLDDPNGTTARDLMGTYDGTISGGVTLNQPGVTGDSTCMTFNGTTGHILTLPVPFPTTMTIEGWVKTAAGAGSGVHALLSDRGAGSHSVLAGLNGLVPAVYNDFAGGEASSGLTITVATWYHFVYLLSATTTTFYVNGALVLAVAQAHTGSPAPKAAGIATDAVAGGFNFWNGSLQDVAIYPRALTPAEILAHYQLRVPA